MSKYAIDLSDNNTAFNWDKLNSDVSAVLLKGIEGQTLKDPDFLPDLSLARKKGLDVGEYIFWHPKNDPKAVADLYFSRGFDFSDPHSICPIIDCEQTKDDAWVSANKKTVQASLHTLVDLLKAGSKRSKCIIYTDHSWWVDTFGNPDFSNDCELWLAAYQNVAPKPVGGWKDYVLWQFSERGNYSGPQTGGDIDWSIISDGVQLAQIGR